MTAGVTAAPAPSVDRASAAASGGPGDGAVTGVASSGSDGVAVIPDRVRADARAQATSDDDDDPDNDSDEATEEEGDGGPSNVAPVSVDTTASTASGKVDVVFLIDTSGSMADEISAVTSGLRNFARTLDNKNIDARYAIVTYATGSSSSDRYTVRQTYTSSVSQTEQTLSNIGTGGAIEYNFDALDGAIDDLNERSDANEVFIDFTDEDSDVESDSPTRTEIANRMSREGITFIAVSPGAQNVANASLSKQQLANDTADGVWFDIAEGNFSAKFENEIPTTVANRTCGPGTVVNAAKNGATASVSQSTWKGDPTNIIDCDDSTKWQVAGNPNNIVVTFTLPSTERITGDYIDISGTGGNRDVSRYVLYARNASGQPWRQVETVSGSVTADGDDNASHSFRTPFWAKQVRLVITDHTAPQRCYSSCDVPLAEYRLYGNGTGAGGLNVRITQIDASNFGTIDVYAEVSDSAGNPILGLGRSNFDVTEDGVDEGIQSVTTVGGGASSVSAALVVDTSGSMSGDRIRNARQGAKTFVGNMRSGDRATVVEFDSSVQIVQPWTTSQGALNNSIDTLTAGGQTALYDGAVKGVREAQSQPGRSAVIVLADGQNNAGTNSRSDAIRIANRENVPIYTIGLDVQGSGAARNLELLANRTGGQYYETNDPNALSRIYRDISQRIANEYRIRYVTHDPATDGTTRRVELTADVGSDRGSDTDSYVAPGSSQGGTDVRYDVSTVNVGAGATTTVDVVVTNASDGVGTYDFETTVADGSVAKIVDVQFAGNPSVTDLRWGQNNESVRVVGIQSDTADSGQVTIATLTVQGVAVGTTTMDLSVNTLADENNDPYQVANTPSSTVSVTQQQVPTLPGAQGPATDPDNDGQYEDLTGDGTFDAIDVTFMLDLLLRANGPPSELVNNPQYFDFNNDGAVNTIDVTTLLGELLP